VQDGPGAVEPLDGHEGGVADDRLEPPQGVPEIHIGLHEFLRGQFQGPFHHHAIRIARPVGPVHGVEEALHLVRELAFILEVPPDLTLEEPVHRVIPHGSP
jgi:hypothetical protein